MLIALEEFIGEQNELRKLKDERNQEQFLTNRLIKNEVIDMAERMDDMQVSL